jgi:hypothetical protein
MGHFLPRNASEVGREQTIRRHPVPHTLGIISERDRARRPWSCWSQVAAERQTESLAPCTALAATNRQR